ncbi:MULTISPECIES: hypothetical protein [Streptomyces]|uniref:hypothetical protein n=1 Tax=Streptomyces TaxID=1883 RepID=UPI001EFB5C6D|nr:hypothetical protein [Streptomyces sp. CL12-4]
MPVRRQYAAISMATMFIVSAASVARSRHALPGVPLVGLGVRQHLLAVRDRLGDQLVKRPPQRPGHLRVLHGRTVEGTEGRLSTTIKGTVRCVQNRARLIRALCERLDRLDAALTQTV